jgi:hypothetical protein
VAAALQFAFGKASSPMRNIIRKRLRRPRRFGTIAATLSGWRHHHHQSPGSIQSALK